MIIYIRSCLPSPEIYVLLVTGISYAKLYQYISIFAKRVWNSKNKIYLEFFIFTGNLSHLYSAKKRIIFFLQLLPNINTSRSLLNEVYILLSNTCFIFLENKCPCTKERLRSVQARNSNFSVSSDMTGTVGNIRPIHHILVM